MNKAIKILSLSLALLFLISLFTLTPVAQVEPPTPQFDIDGKSAGVYDVTHGRFIFKENAYEIVNTSTSAKIMMGLIACEQLGNRLEEKVTVTDKMISSSGGYSMKLKAGEVISVKDLLYGAICGSYNDAAYVLASVVSGSTESFVAQMNARADQLGTTDTAYTNPIGFPDSSAMVTTLADTVKIAEAAYRNELYMKICSTVSYETARTNLSSPRSFYNRNYLLSSDHQYNYYNRKCSGMNAGMSGEAGGWSIVTVAHDDGADLICIVLGGTEDDKEIYAYKTINDLINWACREYDMITVFEKGDAIGTVDVGLTGFGSEKAVYIADEQINAYVPTNNSSVTYKLELDNGELKAPLKAGERIGVINIYTGGELLCSAPAAIKESYERNFIMLIIDMIGRYTKSRAFIITLILFVILLPLSIVLQSRRTVSRRRGGFRRRY